MGKSINKCILLGNLTQDPEIRTTNNGTTVATVKMATNERFKGSDGQWQDRPEYHTVVVWQKLADVAAAYLKKGSKCYVEGRIQTRSWEKDGVKRFTTEIVASDLVLLGGAPQNGTERAEQPSDEEVAIPF